MLFPLIALGVSVIHLIVGDVGWFFRYEDYMVMLLGIGLITQLFDVFPLRAKPKPALVVVLVLAVLATGAAVLASARRGDVALRSTSSALKNIYDQQYQLAHFLKATSSSRAWRSATWSPSRTSTTTCACSISGLALNGVPVAWLAGTTFTQRRSGELTERNGAQIAIVFPDYFDVPAEWRQAGTWTIDNDLVTFGPTVAFYAIPPTDPAALAEAMRAYERTSLPADVHADLGY